MSKDGRGLTDYGNGRRWDAQWAQEDPETHEWSPPLPQQPQFQGSLEEQLRRLQALANRAGLYDAADWIRARLDEQDARRR